jgi:putative addiction module component (TIGR02574 family)
MHTSVEDLAAQAIHLSTDDRTRLAGLLLASLPEGVDADVDAAWDAEIRRRVDEVSAGTADLVASHDVHAAARAIYQR